MNIINLGLISRAIEALPAKKRFNKPALNSVGAETGFPLYRHLVFFWLNSILVFFSPLQTFTASGFKIAANIGAMQVVFAHSGFHIQPNTGTIE